MGSRVSIVQFLKVYKTHILIAAVLSILVIAYQAGNRESRTIEESRSAAPGEFSEGSLGKTHYLTEGRDGEAVVLIHGFSAASFVWDKTAPVLGKAGFHTIRYDLYGRGYSDRPDASYDDDLYDRQLLDLVQGTRLRAPVNIVGLSMGGRIAVNFADRHPGLVKRLVLVDCAGYDMKLPAAGYLMQVPGLGEYLSAVFGGRMIIKRTPENFFRPERYPEFIEKMGPQTYIKGYRRSILSSTRHMLGSINDVYERVGRTNLPILIFWGREDQVIPLDRGERLRPVMPNAQFEVIDQAGHLPQYEEPQKFNRILVKFLTTRPAAHPAKADPRTQEKGR